MGLGVLAFVYAFAMGIPGQRVWANVLVNVFFFLSIGMGATFYLAKKYAAEASYAIVYKRVYEAISGYLPYGAALLIIFLLLGQFHIHHIYHWMDADVYKEFLEDGVTINPEYDKIIANKAPYFNPIFFWGRILLFFGLYWLAQNTFRKRSLEEDMTGDFMLYRKNITTSAWFLVVFGFTSPVLVWDTIMSIDTHWFSTMFGWYVFAGFWCTTMITITLFSLHLKGKGHLQEMNDNHFHDLGKWVFALSVLWSYTFFCQFMLIWYANIPEEVTYFQDRLGEFGYRPLFWMMFFINLALPLIVLMSRDAKRNATFLKVIGCILLCTHWLDVFIVVMPGSVASNWGIGPLEIGMFLGFAGLFIFVVLGQLAKAPLMVQKHPFLEESKHHQV
ncbi:MAG: quinol:cytochrome C oxidoreductase [Bacteroidetes bacterium]|nr:MAG: quinol:cytochrome C oxidoreductase [Bacteroidota bacterium]